MSSKNTMKKMLTLKVVKEVVLSFDDWKQYSKTDAKDYNEEEEYEVALKKEWEALLEETDGEVVKDDEEPDENEIEEMLDEYDTAPEPDKTNPKLMEAINKVYSDFEALGVVCKKDWTCCNTCGHHEIDDEFEEGEKQNYVFYHTQNTDDSRGGADSVHLAFNFDDADVRRSVVEYCKTSPICWWAGEDHTKLFITHDPKVMESQKKDDEVRQKRMKEMEEKVAAEKAVVAGLKKDRLNE